MKKLLGLFLCVMLLGFIAAPAGAYMYAPDEFLGSTILEPPNKNPADERDWLFSLTGDDPGDYAYYQSIDFGSGPKVLEDYSPGFAWDYAIVKIGQGQTKKEDEDWLFAYRDNPDDEFLTIGGAGDNSYPFLNGISHIQFVSSQPVPEPATMLLLGTGLIGLAGVGRKKIFK